MKRHIIILTILALFPIFLSAQSREAVIPEDYIKDPNKPILVMFTASWCAPCQTMKQNIFLREDVKPLLDQMNVLMMDVDTREGRRYKSLLDCAGDGIPCLLLMDTDQNILGKFIGAPRSREVGKFIDFLNKVLTE